MRISVSSNVISAVYIAIFDLLFPVLLAVLVRVFLSSWNLKLIYHFRKPVYLTSTKLSVVVNQGLTERRVGRIVAVVSTTIVGLLVAGGFSIAGESRELIERVTAPVVVDSAAPHELIDFTEHISSDGKLASGTYLAIRDALFCNTVNVDTLTRYSAINDLPDLTSVKWPTDKKLYNSTCRTERNKYVEKVLSHESVPNALANFSTCNLIVELDPTTRLGRAARAEAVNCPYEIFETWCAIASRVVCVGLVKFPAGYTTVQMVYTFNESTNSYQAMEGDEREVYILHQLDTKLESISLKSMAFILATVYGKSPGNYSGPRTIAISTVRTNVLVEQYSGVVNETEVDLSLLLPTVGSALFLMLLLTVVTLRTWKQTVYDHGRQNYNCFHTAADLLSCAICEVKNDGRCKFKRVEPIIVGLDQIGPRLGPVLRVKDLDASLYNKEMLESVDAEESDTLQSDISIQPW